MKRVCGTASKCCLVSDTKDGWSPQGRLPGGGSPGSWALKNGYVFGERQEGKVGQLGRQRDRSVFSSGQGLDRRHACLWGMIEGCVQAQCAAPLGAWGRELGDRSEESRRCTQSWLG